VEVHEVSPCTGARYVVLVQPARPAPVDRDLRRRFQLTPQQVQVALLLRERLSDREIAQALGIALNTASNHVKVVRHKLDATSRRDVPAIIEGLGRPPDSGS
jgi:DNA-binding CsgD family transcriptional regulator